MLTLDSLPARDLRPIGVFTDIDDTLTTEGAITHDALQALADLKAAGLCVVPITGRPVGWSEPFVQSWPVDAIVAENGAVGLLHTPGSGLRKIYQQDADTRARHFARMQEVAQRVLRAAHQHRHPREHRRQHQGLARAQRAALANYERAIQHAFGTDTLVSIEAVEVEK